MVCTDRNDDKQATLTSLVLILLLFTSQGSHVISHIPHWAPNNPTCTITPLSIQAALKDG